MNLAQSIITRNLERHALKAAVGFKKRKTSGKNLAGKKFSEMIAKNS